jgi:hypothetical protein
LGLEVYKVFKELQAPKANREFKAILDLRVLRVFKASRGILEILDLKVSREILVRLACRELRVTRGQLVSLVQMD